MFHDMVGGMPLNFKVTGNPKPTTVRENTIWVDTYQVNGWYFDMDQPEAAEEGAVWIRTGTSSATEFNAFKKNGVQVYPLYAMQLIDGVWENIHAEIYQGEKWNKWVYAYLGNGVNNLGEPEISILVKASTGIVTASSFDANANGSFILNMANSSGWVELLCGFPEEIDLSNYSTLTLKYRVKSLDFYKVESLKLQLLEVYGGGAGESSANVISSTTIAGKNTATNTELTVTIDVATIQKCYVGFWIYLHSSGDAVELEIIDLIPD